MTVGVTVWRSGLPDRRIRLLRPQYSPQRAAERHPWETWGGWSAQDAGRPTVEMADASHATWRHGMPRDAR